MRNGFILHTYATLQFFYAADGTISFSVLGVEKFTATEFSVPHRLLQEWPN